MAIDFLKSCMNLPVRFGKFVFLCTEMGFNQLKDKINALRTRINEWSSQTIEAARSLFSRTTPVDLSNPVREVELTAARTEAVTQLNTNTEERVQAVNPLQILDIVSQSNAPLYRKLLDTFTFRQYLRRENLPSSSRPLLVDAEIKAPSIFAVKRKEREPNLDFRKVLMQLKKEDAIVYTRLRDFLKGTTAQELLTEGPMRLQITDGHRDVLQIMDQKKIDAAFFSLRNLLPGFRKEDRSSLEVFPSIATDRFRQTAGKALRIEDTPVIDIDPIVFGAGIAGEDADEEIYTEDRAPQGSFWGRIANELSDLAIWGVLLYLSIASGESD